jgi:hypothetical protein
MQLGAAAQSRRAGGAVVSQWTLKMPHVDGSAPRATEIFSRAADIDTDVICY